MRGHADCKDRAPISDAEQWDWMGGGGEGGSRTGWRSRNRAPEWDQVARFSPSPNSWGPRSRHLSAEDVDWDRGSVDRWTWGSTDSWEDRGVPRSRSGSRTGVDSRDSPSCGWRCAGGRRSSSRHLSSPEWWTGSRQTSSPHSLNNTRASRCHSLRSCSPCSSTSVSELSWEWSRSSTCSGVPVDGLAISSGRMSAQAPGHSSEALQEARKQDTSSSNTSSLMSSSAFHRSPGAPTSPVPNMHHCDQSPSQLKDPCSKSDLVHGPSAPFTTCSSGATGKASPSKSEKPARTLLLPLIGKLPAIQRKARRKSGLLDKSQERLREEEGAAKAGGVDSGAADTSQKCSPDAAETNPSGTPNLCPSQIRTDDKRAGGETKPPISFTAEEMDKYRVLQEQAREHMQKVLERTQDAHRDTNYTHGTQTEKCRTSEEQYTPVPAHPHPAQPVHLDTMQTRAQRTLQVGLQVPHVTAQETFTQPLALAVPNLPPLPPSPPLHSLPHHIILQPSLPHPLHLSPFSVSSLVPSILLSHHPIPLLPQSAAFHTTPLGPLSPVALQPLNPQPFMDRAWPVRFQQKAI